MTLCEWWRDWSFLSTRWWVWWRRVSDDVTDISLRCHFVGWYVLSYVPLLSWMYDGMWSTLTRGLFMGYWPLRILDYQAGIGCCRWICKLQTSDEASGRWSHRISFVAWFGQFIILFLCHIQQTFTPSTQHTYMINHTIHEFRILSMFIYNPTKEKRWYD